LFVKGGGEGKEPPGEERTSLRRTVCFHGALFSESLRGREPIFDGDETCGETATVLDFEKGRHPFGGRIYSQEKGGKGEECSEGESRQEI